MPGRHNSSSIEGGEQRSPPNPLARSRLRLRVFDFWCRARAGIFGEAPIVANVAPPSNPNVSSVQGGIFGAPVAPAPDKREAVTKSSVMGGIFAEPMQNAPNMARNVVTNSSVEGGIFGGYNHVEAPISHAPAVQKRPVESLGVAGAINPKSDAVSLSWSEEANVLQPLPSARSNPNASSIQGGIFGSTPVAAKPAMTRHDPNASSIQGGIFG